MAALDTSRTMQGAASAFGAFFARAFGVIAAWNDARATRHALASLSDHELEDIGLVRGDIDAVTQFDLIR